MFETPENKAGSTAILTKSVTSISASRMCGSQINDDTSQPFSVLVTGKELTDMATPWVA